MNTSTSQVYAVYLTVATATQPVGTVVNNVVWNGVVTVPWPTGQDVIADPNRQYPIGSVYTAPAST